MNTNPGSQVIGDWPKESREAAKLVIEKYGEPDEATPTQLVWHERSKWKRIVATKAFYAHDFPYPHFDSVQGSSTTECHRRSSPILAGLMAV